MFWLPAYKVAMQDLSLVICSQVSTSPSIPDGDLYIGLVGYHHTIFGIDN